MVSMRSMTSSQDQRWSVMPAAMAGETRSVLWDADEVVMHHVDGERVDMVLDLLAEGVRQARKAPERHADREIVSLDHRCRDMVRIWRAFDPLALRGDHFCRTIARLAFGLGRFLGESGEQITPRLGQ